MDIHDDAVPQGPDAAADVAATPGVTRGSFLATAGIAAAGAAAVASGVSLVRPGVALAAGGDEIAPAPPSIGADVPLTYFGPSPSQVQKELIGPLQLLRSGELDLDEGTITLPLYKGRAGSQTQWFVLTDTTDATNAAALGLNHSAKLIYSQIGKAVRDGEIQSDLSVVFKNGMVNFAPVHKVVPGAEPNPFPPTTFTPGSRGDANYSPLVRLTNAGNHIYSASVVAVGSEQEIDAPKGNPNNARVHDKVVRLSAKERTVTLALTPGFSFARPILYLSLEANAELPAAMEGVTFAPALADVPVGRDDGAFSAVERLFAIVNGPRGKANPQRQGFNSALAGEGNGPLSVLGGIPTVATDYSPLWDVNAGEWTKKAIDAGFRSRVTEEFQILGLVQQGHMTGPGGGAFGSTKFIVNCPIVHRFL
jgi:hypothetical protein